MTSPVFNGYGSGGWGQFSKLSSSSQTDTTTNSVQGSKLTFPASQFRLRASSEKPQAGKGFWENFKDFFKGVGAGAKSLLLSLTKPSTWLLVGAAIAITAVFPPAGALLVGAGLGLGGAQLIKGVATGDYEKAGEGAFNIGITATGAAVADKAITESSNGITAQGVAAAGKAGKFLANDVSTAGTIKDASKLAAMPFHQMG